jgi:hypothetical protein
MRSTPHGILFNLRDPNRSQIALELTENDFEASLHAEHTINATFPFILGELTSKSSPLSLLATATGGILNGPVEQNNILRIKCTLCCLRSRHTIKIQKTKILSSSISV